MGISIKSLFETPVEIDMKLVAMIVAACDIMQNTPVIFVRVQQNLADIITDTSSSVSETLSSEESCHSEENFDDPLAFLDELRHSISSAVNMPSSSSMCSVNFDPKLDIVPSAPINFAVQKTEREEAPSTLALLNETSNNSIIQTLLFQEQNSGGHGERLPNVDEAPSMLALLNETSNNSIIQTLLFQEQNSEGHGEILPNVDEVSLSSTARIEHFISDDALQDVNQNDPAIQELDKITCEVNQIDVYDDVFESFGKYIASLLRSLPNRRGMELQQEIINLVLKSHVSACFKYNESVVCSPNHFNSNKL
ncbi:hypothetical protein C0J52_22407 [Blattella germanica]|nr:hypothetical protein C0J52_22407 [Blattella germanica]